MQLSNRIKAALASLPNQEAIDVAIMLGTGLSDSLEPLLAQGLSIREQIAYEDIAEFPHSSVISHRGELALAEYGGLKLAIFHGRFHLYEGWSALDTAFPVYLANALQAKHLLVSNAAGALNAELRVGGLMLITDHLNMTGQNPLTGWEDETIGPRFPDMLHCYSPALIRLAEQAGEQCGIQLNAGIYAGVPGPSLETSAERRFLRTAGGDAVGMSTIMEVIAARQCGLEVLGLSAITNIATGQAEQSADSIDSVLRNAALAARELGQLLPAVLAELEG